MGIEIITVLVLAVVAWTLVGSLESALSQRPSFSKRISFSELTISILGNRPNTV